jgi:hypothetical protein
MGRWALTLVIVESRGGAHFTVELKVVLVMKNPQTALFYAIVVMRKSGMKDTF